MLHVGSSHALIVMSYPLIASTKGITTIFPTISIAIERTILNSSMSLVAQDNLIWDN
jgi:hypothetical protein